nr:hypothetical protein [uncultured Desulfuromonas sp.]
MNSFDIKTRLEAIKKLYESAKAEMSKIKGMGGEIWLPAINELRYVGEHILKASTSDSDEIASAELDKAEAHCWRAISDCAEMAVVYTLKDLHQLQEDYRSLPISEYVPAYEEIIQLARKLQILLTKKGTTHPSQYYSKVNELLPEMVERLSLIPAAREELNKNLKEKQIKSKKWLVGLFIGIVASLSSNYLYQVIVPPAPKADSIQAQISNLEEIQSSLSILQNYVSKQQDRLNTLNTDIKSLSEKKQSLEKVVSINEEAVQQLLNTYKSSSKSTLVVDLLLSFFVGCLSSLFVFFLVSFLKRRKFIKET